MEINERVKLGDEVFVYDGWIQTGTVICLKLEEGYYKIDVKTHDQSCVMPGLRWHQVGSSAEELLAKIVFFSFPQVPDFDFNHFHQNFLELKNTRGSG